MKTLRSPFLCAAVLGLAMSVGAQTYEVRSVTIVNGSGPISGGHYSARSTIGQPALGTVSGGPYSLDLGVENQLAPPSNGTDVDLMISATPAPLAVTENIESTLSLSVVNRGTAPANAVQLAVHLPAGLPVVSVSSDAGTCAMTASNVSCSIASLPSQAAVTVELTVRARFLPEEADEFEHLSNLSAVISAAEPDLNPADNSLALPVIVWLQRDWGDARGGFPVSFAENGARHRFWPGYRLGALWDRQADGFHSLLADWDDTHVAADEDGIVFLTPLVPGTPATVEVHSSFGGFLDAWADFNNDSDWADLNERLFSTSQTLVPGSNTFTFSVPATAVPGLITTRWRASVAGGLNYTGFGGKGEVEDHMAEVQAQALVDLKVTMENVPIEAEIAGQSFPYNVTVSNAGPNDASDVRLVVAHEGLAVSDLTAATQEHSCEVVGGEVRCAIGQLAVGQSVRVGVSVTPLEGGILRIRSTATIPGPDLQPADNLADHLTPVIWNVQECACSCYSNAPRPVPDPLLTSWFTKNSGRYARSVLTNGDPARLSWNRGPNDPDPREVSLAYADVQEIQYDAGFVYITGNGLASYEMGPWYCEPGNFFPQWPTKQTNPAQIPFAPDPSACDNTHMDAIGLWVNGTAIYNMMDGYFFVQGRDQPESGMISADDNPPGLAMTGVWNRDAWFSEKETFDPAYFHTAQGQYHSHASPRYLRVQLGDNLAALANPDDPDQVVYHEQQSPLLRHHSPILGWAFDGHPIYGPYGYSDPDDPTSGVRRMRSGYVKRDGRNGTSDLSATASGTGRTTLPTWKRLVLGLTTSALDPGDYGPSTDRATDITPCNDIDFAIGRYAEDHAYLGHLINPDDGDWYRMGEDFDLDLHNGRCCKTPEFPEGTYAYFVTIADDPFGTPLFPYVLGWQYCGRKLGSENASVPATGVETHFAAIHPRLIDPDLRDWLKAQGPITLQWSSREGGTYRVWAGEDLAHPQEWAPVSPSLPSDGTTSSYTFDPGTPRPPKQFYRVELERDGGPPSQPGR